MCIRDRHSSTASDCYFNCKQKLILTTRMDEVTFEKKIDGFVIFGETWNFLRPGQNAGILLPIYIQSVELKKCFKGSRLLSVYKFGWSVRLFFICDMQVDLLFLGNIPNVCYHSLIKVVKDCLSLTLNALG